jgi:hypothetical protein
MQETAGKLRLCALLQFFGCSRAFFGLSFRFDPARKGLSEQI